MKKLYTFLLFSIGLSSTFNFCRAQTIVEANVLVASSSDFIQANLLVDGDASNYGYLSASAGILTNSSITVSFPQIGHAGDIVSFDIQAIGGLLSTSLLNNITIRLYDENNVNVANGTGSSLLGLDLSIGGGPKVYTLKYMTDATASYHIKKATLEINSLLSVQLLDELRIYNARLQTPCNAIYATSVAGFATNGLLGYVSNETNAVSASTTDFASLIVPAVGPSYLDLAFTTKGIAGEYVGFTVGKSPALVSVDLLSSIIITAYNTAGNPVAIKNNFALADLRLLDGSTDKYYLGFVTPAGSYDIAKLRITLGGISVLNSIDVYNGMHFKLAPQPVSITAASATVCAGNSVTLTANAGSLSNIVWSTGATTNTINVSGTSIVSFTATDNQGCVSTSSPISITQLPIPTVSITTGPTATFCAGGSVNLTATPSANTTLLWSNGATTATTSVSTAGTYTVVATHTNLCASLPASVTVSSLPVPTVSISNGPTATFCAGGSVNLTATPSANTTLLWSNGATTASTSVSTAGTYTVVATHTNLCASLPASVTVSSLPLPTVSISNGPTATFCAGGSVNLTATPSANTTLLWSNGATTASTSVSTAGTYTVVATHTNLCASLPASVTVSSLPLPTVSISNGPTATFCAGGSVNLTATPSANTTLLWSNGATTASTSVSTAGTYTVVATHTNLCASLPASVTVSSLPLPTVSITAGPTATFCAGGSVNLTATPSANTTLLWSNGATTASTSVSTAGTYTVVATHTNLCASLPASVTVSSLPLPTVSITAGPTATFCAGGSVNLTATPSANTTLLWSNGATTASTSVSTAGTYTVVATHTNLCASLPASVTVSSLPLPTVSITAGPTATFCTGGSVNLTATPSANTTLLWSNGATTATTSVSTAGTYTVVATHTNLCASLPASVVVSSLALPTVSVSASGPLSFCSTQDVTLSATASAGSNVLWSNGDASSQITVHTAGNYSVTATDANGCEATSAGTTVTIFADPQVSETINNITCFGLGNGMITLTPVSSSASYQYDWSNGASGASINNLIAGQYTVEVTDNTTSCIADFQYSITEPAVLTLTGTASNETCSGNDGSIALTVTGGTAPYSSTMLPTTVNANAHITNLIAGSYNVVITDKNLCQATQAFQVVKANCTIALNIHNIVTPNNDGLNDVMVIEGIENYPGCSLEIFDKWGDVVYNANNYNNNWNGRNKNDSGPLPAGTYYYLLKLNSSEVPNGTGEYTGFVMIQ